MKGITNNPNGRPTGKGNKVTTEIRELFTALLKANISKIQSDIDQLEPKDRIRNILELSKFVLPQLRSTDLIINEDEKNKIDFSKLSTDDLTVLLEIYERYEIQ